jgi:iron complex outermembrane recepter protein
MSLTLRLTLLLGVATPLLSASAFAQTTPAAPAAAAETADSDQIIVTGTRRSNRTVSDSPVAVDVISAEALSRSGATETNKLLNFQVPSFNFPQPSVTDGTDVIRPATLRGLGPDQTLVLINGKRRHTAALLNVNNSIGRGTAAVDVNLIPSIAIERVEVLRDGAAAQYGSDAIAGVINFQLKKKNSGGLFTVTYGEYDTRVKGVPQAAGLLLDANGQPLTNPDGTYQLQTSGKDRRVKDGRTVTVAGNIGLPLGPEGYVNLSAEYRDRAPTNRTGYDTRRQYGTTGPIDPRELTFNRLSHRFGDPRTTDYVLFANAGLPLGDFEAYTTVSYAKRNGESAGFYRRANDARNRNFSASTTTFVPFYADGFLPLINTDTKDFAAIVGVKADLSDWNVDLSYTYGRNQFDFNISNSFNTSLGAASPTTFDSGGLSYRHNVVNFDVQRDLALGFAEKVSFAFGAEYRQEKFGIRAGELNSFIAGPFAPPAPISVGAPAGAQVFPGFRPANAGTFNRNNKSVYAELDADVTSAWNVTIAGRYENYSDFGSTVNGKIASKFQIIDQIGVRASASTGFRAPSLQQQFFSSTATNNIGGTLVEVSTFPVTSLPARQLGAVPLKAEKSVNFAVGLVLKPIDNLSITIDAYQIKIKDRIVLSENLGAGGTATDAQIRTIAGGTAGRFFINGIDTRTRGVEAVATYRIPTDTFGDFRLTASYAYNKTEVTRIAALPGALLAIPALAGNPRALFNVIEQKRFEQGQPRSKLNLGADWDRDFVGVSLKANRFGSVLSAGANPLDDVTLEAKWIADLEVRIKPAEFLQLAIGADNIFDQYPTRLPTGARPAALGGNYSVNNYFLPYSSFSPFGFNGRFIYVRATANF